MRILCFAAAAALLVAARSATAADRIELTSGAVVEGKIESETETKVVLRIGDETRELPRSIVARIMRESAPAATAVAPVRPAPAAAPQPGTRADAAATAVPVIAPPVKGTAGSAASKADGGRATPVAAPSAATSPAPAEPEQVVADWAVASALGSADSAKITAAADTIVAGWPGTAPTLRIALASPTVAARREAVLLLDRAELAGAAPLLASAASDAEASVRVLAIRGLRKRGGKDHEALLLSLFATDSEAVVRNECLRTLEVLGSVTCLAPVLDSLAKAETPDARRRHLRVLRAVTGRDGGDDVAAWREIVRKSVLDAHLAK